MKPEIWALAFFCMVLLDIAWALYTKATSDSRPIMAANWAVALHGLGAAVTLAYVDDVRYMSATLVGAWVGTYIGVVGGKR